jgi:hypothetical protein
MEKEEEVSRPDKGNHAATILYEIEMVRFAAEQQFESNFSGYAFLECFLLHYRNLIEFLGNEPKKRHISTDLCVSNIWLELKIPEPRQLTKIQEEGKKLYERYEPSTGVKISQYLHHCTTHRMNKKKWNVSRMMRELNPLLIEVEEALGQNPQAVGQGS